MQTIIRSNENPGVVFTVIEPLTRPADLWYTANYGSINIKCEELVSAYNNSNMVYVVCMALDFQISQLSYT